MKLQRHRHSEYKGREYYKYEVIIPSEIVGKLGWSEGQEIRPEVKGRKLILKSD